MYQPKANPEGYTGKAPDISDRNKNQKHGVNQETFEELLELAQDLWHSPGGDSYVIYNGETYNTDIPYAWDGIVLFLKLIQFKYNLEIPPYKYTNFMERFEDLKRI